MAGHPAAPLQVLVPQAPVPVADVAGNHRPAGPRPSTTVTLQLLPAADLPLGSYTGEISLVGAESSLNVPFQFLAVSQAKGNVVIDAQDESTFFTQGAPLVAGASVILSDPQTGAAVASGTTGADGTLELDGLQVGTYNVLVQAQGHNAYQGAVTVQAGMTATVDAFMTSQLVTYQFNVTPTTIQDQYTFTVNTTFKTNVPVPVVTISPAYIDFSTLTSDTTQINFTLTNQGLIAAQDVGLHFDSNSEYQVTPLVGLDRRLPAGSSVVVPVTIQRLSVSAGCGSAERRREHRWLQPRLFYIYSYQCQNHTLVYTQSIGYIFGVSRRSDFLPQRRAIPRWRRGKWRLVGHLWQ